MDQTTQTTATGPVVMYYCHDTYGLGHLSRTRALARQLRARRPDVSQMIVTGSPVAQDLLDPGDTEGADYIKLPSVVKVGAERYAARSLATAFAAVRDMRGDILASAARHLRPDVFVVDHAPAGLKGEALPALRHLAARRPGTRLVLGLRDIVDDPAAVRAAWRAAGVYELLDRVYDRILVYGQRDVFDVARAYGLSDRAARKLRYVGYLGHRPAGRPAAGDHPDAAGRRGSGNGARPLVMAVAGGGGDGFGLLAALLEGLRERETPAFDCRLVAGPLMDPRERARLRALAEGLAAVEVVDFDPGLAATLGTADAVVAMGGYNTVCELMASRRPALIVPRVHPRREQLLRAELLAGRGLIRMLHPDHLAPDRLVAAVDDLLARPPRPRVGVALDGVRVAAAEIEALIDDPARAAAGTDPAARGWLHQPRSLPALAAS